MVTVCTVAQGERRIRGSGVYPMSSLLNHDCMPNVARYDYFDGPQEDNTIVEFRALHDIPADTQITQSYFPLSWWACFSHVLLLPLSLLLQMMLMHLFPTRQAGTALNLSVTALSRVVLRTWGVLCLCITCIVVQLQLICRKMICCTYGRFF